MPLAPVVEKHPSPSKAAHPKLSYSEPLTVCSIGIIREKGVPIDLRIFPAGLRSLPNEPVHPVIFYPAHGTHVSEELPRQVLWTIHTLEPRERIFIERKPGADDIFDSRNLAKPFVIPGGHGFLSGRPNLSSLLNRPSGLSNPGKHPIHTWEYSITLETTHGGKPVKVQLDPSIVIEPDPK